MPAPVAQDPLEMSAYAPEIPPHDGAAGTGSEYCPPLLSSRKSAQTPCFQELSLLRPKLTLFTSPAATTWGLLPICSTTASVSPLPEAAKPGVLLCPTEILLDEGVVNLYCWVACCAVSA